ncbi:nucleotidyltransferase family protein [Micromonospora sp. NBC_01412]|uniref:nucleotidyltransferase family protein n=1 Tax=Micromonospora sp. NBC_01412 TaxID=2903590 RepID=UPI0032481A3C
MTALPASWADPADIGRGDELRELVRANASLMRALTVVRDSGIPDAWIGAGVLRDLVWGCRYGTGFDLCAVRDVDVAFFDPADLSRDNDQRTTGRLAALEPGLGAPFRFLDDLKTGFWIAPPVDLDRKRVAPWRDRCTRDGAQVM